MLCSNAESQLRGPRQGRVVSSDAPSPSVESTASQDIRGPSSLDEATRPS